MRLSRSTLKPAGLAAGAVALALAGLTPAVVEWARPLHWAIRLTAVLAFMGVWGAAAVFAGAAAAALSRKRRTS